MTTPNTATLSGIHHITAIAGNPQQNIDFYTGVLGLRLVKLTVNFDDPGTYHFYYGDETGNPGTILTFFPFAGARRGRRGAGQTTALAFSVPAGSLDYWHDRLTAARITPSAETARFGDEVLAFDDPDGLGLELVVRQGGESRPGWGQGPVPLDKAIRGFDSLTLTERDTESTTGLLVDGLGFRQIGQDGARTRFAFGQADEPATWVDVVRAPHLESGIVAAGSVHHVAWRTPDDAQQEAWRTALVERGLQVSPIMDRQYFHSIYVREPGGVLFEIATDAPGFATDESIAALGTRLMLPPWMETHRSEIERTLPPLRLPDILVEAQ